MTQPNKINFKISDLIFKKALAKELSTEEYYAIVCKMMENGISEDVKKVFTALHEFGMTKNEVLSLALAIRDSGAIYKTDDCILEKHSTGGIGDSTSIVLIPLLSCLGYKIIKTSGKSLVYANGSADRFKSIPGFEPIKFDQIEQAMIENNACVLTHGSDYCPADKLLFELIEDCQFENNINFLAASIVAKKLTSGAKIVLVDIKYGESSVIEEYSTALKLKNLLKFLFGKCGVECVIAITNTHQLIGSNVGNALEVEDALDVLQGKHCMLRDVATKYAVAMMVKAERNLSTKDAKDMVDVALDTGTAYNHFLRIVEKQHGDVDVVKNKAFFQPKMKITFKAERSGYVGNINAKLMGELIRRLCAETHNNNIGLTLGVKIGDFVHEGDTILTLYYEDEEEIKKYLNAVRGCVRITSVKVRKVKPIKRIC